MKILIAYVPVLHRGYEKFFLRHHDVDKLFVFGPATLSQFDWLKKDLRSLSPERVVSAIRSWGVFQEVSFLEDIPIEVIQKASLVVMPDETECRVFAELNLVGVPVFFDSVGLRYDRKKTESTADIQAVEVNEVEALSLMEIAEGLRSKSSDWWIQVGALIARDGKILLTGWNEHKPSDRETLFMGDPRSNYGRGLNVELSLADHAEKVVIGEAAREGIALSGSDLYVTTFPCPSCARLVCRTGIKRLFFRNGYALLDGDSLLREAGIEIFRVKS